MPQHSNSFRRCFLLGSGQWEHGPWSHMLIFVTWSYVYYARLHPRVAGRLIGGVMDGFPSERHGTKDVSKIYLYIVKRGIDGVLFRMLESIIRLGKRYCKDTSFSANLPLTTAPLPPRGHIDRALGIMMSSIRGTKPVRPEIESGSSTPFSRTTLDTDWETRRSPRFFTRQGPPMLAAVLSGRGKKLSARFTLLNHNGIVLT